MKLTDRRAHGAAVSLMILCAICMCLGQLIWKYYDGFLSVAVGFGINAVGALAMLCAYRFGSISMLQPINSISYVIAVVLGSVFFHEAITWEKLLGITAIIMGVVILTRGEKK